MNIVVHTMKVAAAVLLLLLMFWSQVDAPWCIEFRLDLIPGPSSLMGQGWGHGHKVPRLRDGYKRTCWFVVVIAISYHGCS
jgi:hypothetical protein